MGGLDQATASTAEIVAVSGTRAARIGTLLYAVHDAAGATIGGTAYLLGGGEPSYSTILAVDPAAMRRSPATFRPVRPTWPLA